MSEYIGLLNKDGKLVRASECNSQIEGSEFDGPVLWDSYEDAIEANDEFGGISDDHRLVRVILTISEYYHG